MAYSRILPQVLQAIGNSFKRYSSPDMKHENFISFNCLIKKEPVVQKVSFIAVPQILLEAVKKTLGCQSPDLSRKYENTKHFGSFYMLDTVQSALRLLLH